MKKYTIKEFAEGKKAVKIENEEQWNKLNKVYELTSQYHGVWEYGNKQGYSKTPNWYISNGWKVLEFSQLDFEDEFVVGKWYKRVEREGYLYQPEYVYYVKCNSTNKKEKGILNYSERINFGGAYTCYNDYCETDNFVQIDLSEIQQFLPPGHSDLIKKDEFVLPEKWCIKLETREISEAVNSIDLWKDGQLVWYDNESYRERWISYDGEYLRKDKIKDYTEITFEEFKTHILKEETMNTFGLKVGDHLPQEVISEWTKQGNNRYRHDSTWHSSIVYFDRPRTIEEFKTCDGFTGMLVSDTHKVYLKCEGFLEFKESFNKEKTMEKEILGYKLKFDEYKKAALKICNTVANWENSLMDYDISVKQTRYVNELKEAGVLDLWFEVVFAPDKPKLPTIKGKQCVDNGDKTITCGCTTKSFDWILGVDYAMGEEIDISGTKVSDKEIRQIVEYIKNNK